MKVKVLKGFIYNKKPQKIGATIDVNNSCAEELIANCRAEVVAEKEEKKETKKDK